MAHIFGIPHSLSEITGGILESIGSTFGMAAPVQQLPSPNFMTGFDPLGTSMDMFGEAYDLAKSLNVNGATTTTEVTIDNATGKCIAIGKKKTRKRKRRLATLSDIKDIAALKQVFGGGKAGNEAFATWIATRGR